MLTVSVDASAILDRLDSMPEKLRTALADKMDGLGQTLRDYIVDAKLSGQVLQVKSGALRASIDYQVDDDGEKVALRVGSFGDIPYAAIQEFGGKTAAHEIVPNKAGALAFIVEGKKVFARRVHHPGSVIPERSYLRSALADMRGEIVDELTQAARDGVDQP